MKMEPVPENPTIEDACERLTQLHGCLEDLKTGALEEIRGDVALIKRAMNVEDPIAITADPKGTPKPVQGLLTQAAAFRKSVQASATSIVGLFLIYKFMVFMFPSMWGVLKALNAFAIH